MTTGTQTVAGAYQKIESHERECTLRYEALGDAISDVKGETESIKKGIRTALGMLATIVVGLIAWLGAQLTGTSRGTSLQCVPPWSRKARQPSDSLSPRLSFQGLSRQELTGNS